MGSFVGMPRTWWLILISFWLATPVYAQPPERFRLDLGVGYFQRPLSAGFLEQGRTPALVFVGPTDILLFDVTGTLNITERLSLAAGLPFGAVFNARGDKGDEGFGIGNVHAELGYGVLAEQPWLPGVRVRVEGGAPTASFDVLGTKLWRVTPGLTLSKSFTPRFSLFVDGSYSNLFEKGTVDPGPVYSVGGGMGIGITEAAVLTLQVQEIIGAKLEKNNRVVAPFRHDLRAGIVVTTYSQGRPRFSIGILAGDLRDKPTFMTTFKWAILSF